MCLIQSQGCHGPAPAPFVRKDCCLDPVSAPSCVLFLSSYLDETVLGTCSAWMVSGSSCESGTVLVVFSGSGVDATIFATVLGCTEVGLRVFSLRGGSSTAGAVEENHLELAQSSSAGWTCPELLPVPIQLILPPSAVSAAIPSAVPTSLAVWVKTKIFSSN